VQVKALSWNLFHGRDFPPDQALFTWRSRLLRVKERSATHVQMNRELFEEFARVLAGADWDVALLQECPPRWWEPLAAACEAEAHGVLTSRNSFGTLRALVARLNPDLIASAEGGSNLTLARSAVTSPSYRGINHSGRLDVIAKRREMTIHEGRPERRAMALTRIALVDPHADAGPAQSLDGSTAMTLCVANLHATAGRPELAAEDVLRAARAATEWAGDAPLIFGGDLNLRPRTEPGVFDELRERFGLVAQTAPDAIDHLLVRGLDTVEAPRLWPPQRRELHEDGLALRLSDHAPVEGCFATPPPR
jgi:endonuclease/exonuclease/phosphatase family metal-dependent hydrolase